MTEYIVFVKILKNKRMVIGNMRLRDMNGINDPNERRQGSKLIYFEIKKNMRVAQAAENKFRSLTRNKLIEKIRNTNLELLDLKHTVYNTNHIKELIY